MIIDIHTHCFPDYMVAKTMATLSRGADIKPYADGTISGTLKAMDEAGVDISVICKIATRVNQEPTINRDIEELTSDRIAVFGALHPYSDNWKGVVDDLAARGVKGVKLHPDYQKFFVDEPHCMGVYEYVLGKDLAILFHAGYDEGLGFPTHCPPGRFRKVVDTFPGEKMIAAHMGGMQENRALDEAEEFLVGQPVYFDVAYILPLADREQAKRMIQNHGADRVLLGSDSPWGDMKGTIGAVKALGLSETDTRKILGENAAGIIK
jgi:predicted TIM-barrel fold metal-dependent hydrolase